MPIYVYKCRCGTFEELQGINDPPLAKCSNGHKATRVPCLVGRVSTTSPDQESRVGARHARVNREVVNGIVSGTMTAPEDRDVCGDKMPRSAVADFNSKLDHARKMK